MSTSPERRAPLISDLVTSIIGKPLYHYQQVGSTNDLIKQQAQAGAAEGMVILAEEQTAGRGRQGRGWSAPPGSSLLCSLLLRPTWLQPSDAFLLTMLSGVALCEATEQIAPLRAGLKWPNDLWLPAAPDLQTPSLKAAGILSEIEIRQGEIVWVVLGIGINVNWRPTGIVDGRDLSQVATSIAAAAGQEIDRGAMLRALLERLDAHYIALRRGRREALFNAWRARLAMLGQEVRVRLPNGELTGVAEDVDHSGALLLRDATGQLHTITAGDVGN